MKFEVKSYGSGGIHIPLSKKLGFKPGQMVEIPLNSNINIVDSNRSECLTKKEIEKIVEDCIEIKLSVLNKNY